jgi:hypothetical protein
MKRSTRDETWTKVVRIYSFMHLTYDADTLPGLSGLASVWKTLYPDQYLSGLWRTSLAEHLLWRRYLPCPKPPEYQAPSWSWASYPIGTIIWFHRCCMFRELAQISDACCVPTYDVDPTGMVSSGYIRLAAKAAPGKLRFQGRERSSDVSTVDFRGRRRPVSVDCVPESEELDVYVVVIGVQSEGNHETLYFLILSSNGGHPETFHRRGRSDSEVYMKDINLIPYPERHIWGTADEKEWWTSKSEDGWMEFTIV